MKQQTKLNFNLVVGKLKTRMSPQHFDLLKLIGEGAFGKGKQVRITNAAHQLKLLDFHFAALLVRNLLAKENYAVIMNNTVFAVGFVNRYL
jgi:hypothetical protein